MNNFTEKYFNSLFLLIMTISINYLANTVNCSQRKLFSNRLVKYIIIFFTVKMTANVYNNRVNPLYNYGHSIIILFIFIMIEKVRSEFSVLLVIITYLIIIFNQYIDYYSNKKFVSYIKYFQYLLIISFIVILIIGFIDYTIIYLKNNKHFNLIDYLFISNECDKND